MDLSNAETKADTADVSAPGTSVSSRKNRGPEPRSSRGSGRAPNAPSRTGSKQQRVVNMLERPQGATIANIMKATGWQKHSVHGFFAGVIRKKLRLNLTAEGDDGKRTYRVIKGHHAKASRKTVTKRGR